MRFSAALWSSHTRGAFAAPFWRLPLVIHTRETIREPLWRSPFLVIHPRSMPGGEKLGAFFGAIVIESVHLVARLSLFVALFVALFVHMSCALVQ